MPMMPFSGVRSSCDVLARNVSFMRSASSSAAFFSSISPTCFSSSAFFWLISPSWSRTASRMRLKLAVSRPSSDRPVDRRHRRGRDRLRRSPRRAIVSVCSGARHRSREIEHERRRGSASSASGQDSDDAPAALAVWRRPPTSEPRRQASRARRRNRRSPRPSAPARRQAPSRPATCHRRRCAGIELGARRCRCATAWSAGAGDDQLLELTR